jgi:HEAT repeat protein
LTARLAALFQVRPGEGRLAALLVALMFLPAAGGAIGSPGIEALFYSRYGVEYLPYLYMALAAVTPLASFGLTALLGRLRRRQVYLALPVALAAALLAARALVALKLNWFYPALWLGMYLLWTLQSLFAWGLAGSVFHSRQAKRLFPLFAAGSILGLAVGGLLTRPLVGLLGTENLLLVWAAALLGALGLARLVVPWMPPRGLRPRSQPLAAAVLRGWRSVRGIALLRSLAVTALLFHALLYALAFPFARAVLARFPTEDALTGFLGLFQGLNTALALAFSLFLSNRLYARFGFLPAMRVLPAICLAGFGLLLALSLLPGLSPFAALAAFRFAQMVWLHGVALTAQQALFHVAPTEEREPARAFVDGLPAPAGIGLVGLGLVLGGPGLPAWPLYAAGTLAAGVAMIVLARARRQYALALAAALRAGQPQLFYSDETPFGGYPRDAAALDAALRAVQDPDPLARRVAAEVLGHLPDPRAAAALVRALDDPDEEVRLAALRGLARTQGGAAQLDVVPLLNAPEPDVRRQAVETLTRLSPYASGLAQFIRPLLADPDSAVRAAAAAALLKSSPDADAASALRALAAADDPDHRALALQALAEAGDPATYDLAARGLNDANPQVRRAAVLALPQLDRERCLFPLGRALGDDDPGVRDAAGFTLGDLGPAALPVLAAALSDPRQEAGALHGLEALTGGPPKAMLADYARTKAALAQQYAGWRAGVLAQTPANDRLALLAQALDEAARAQARLAVHAAAQLARAPDHHLALEGLDSPDLARRADALELIEGWGQRDLLPPVLAAFEGEVAAPPAASLVHTLTPILHDGDAWLRACAAFAAQGSADLSLLGQLKRLAESDSDELVRAAAQPLIGAEPMESLATLSLLERLVFLKRVPLFAALSTTDLKNVAAVVEERYHPAGAVLARHGQPGDELYIIVSGAVRVVDESTPSRAVELARRAPGEYVGEMAIISQEPRMASLVADGETRVLSLDQRAFEAILRERPAIGLAVMRELCQRLRGAQVAGLARG